MARWWHSHFLDFAQPMKVSYHNFKLVPDLAEWPSIPSDLSKSGWKLWSLIEIAYFGWSWASPTKEVEDSGAAAEAGWGATVWAITVGATFCCCWGGGHDSRLTVTACCCLILDWGDFSNQDCTYWKRSHGFIEVVIVVVVVVARSEKIK